jgi:hypothetical protein
MSFQFCISFFARLCFLWRTGQCVHGAPAVHVQMAVILLVLFIAYALQVRYRPYMSPEERSDVLRDHIFRSMHGGVHAYLALRLKEAESLGKKTARPAGMAQRRAVNYVAAAMLMGYLFNYNTVEMVLLFCCCLITLSGIMFESGRFQTGAFSSQRNAIASFVIVILLLSVAYCKSCLNPSLPLLLCT